MPDYDKLSIKTTENKIDNLDDILKALEEITLEENGVAYLESLLNHLNNAPFDNQDSLIEAISSKLLEYKHLEQEEQNNIDALRQMQEYNEDLKKLNIITTSNLDNDSKKDIDYITFTNESKEVEVLACKNSKTISSFIKKHSDDIAKKSAEEIFKYFKEYIHIDIKFYNPSELEQLYPEVSKQAIKNDEYIKAQELEEMNKYKERYNMKEEVQIGIDPDGERLYRIKDGLFKFKDTINGRVLTVLQTPNLEKSKEIIPENNSEVVEEKIIEDVNITTTPENSDEIIENNTYSNMTLEEFRRLVYDREVNHRVLSPKEDRDVIMYASLLISTMIERAQQPDRDFEIDETLDDFMRDILIKYEAMQDGLLGNKDITQEEINLAEKYIVKKEEIKALNLDKTNEKKLILENNEIPRAGITMIILLIDIIALGIFIMSFISLAN